MKRFPSSFWQQRNFPFLSQIIATGSIPGTITTAFLNAMALANPVQQYVKVEGTYLAGQNCGAGEICLLAVAVPLGQSWLAYNNGSPFGVVPTPYSSPANFTFNGVVYSLQVFTVGSVAAGVVSWNIH
jgi:hypothetical protein